MCAAVFAQPLLLTSCKNKDKDKGKPADYGTYGADIAREIASQYPDRAAYSEGESQTGAYIEGKIKELGLSQNVTMLGNIHDRERLKAIDAAADLFLFPSLYDNAPLVVREAAAMHTPSLMLQDSTAAEVIQPDINGFLTANDKHAYAARICQLMEHPELLQAAGKKASNTIARSWEDVIDEVILRYRDIQESYKIKHGK